MEHEHVVQALALNRTNDALDVGPLPGGSRGAQHFLDTHVSHSSPEGIAAEDSVAIAQQVAGKFIKGERFSQLLSGPLRGWVGGHIEMENAPAVRVLEEVSSVVLGDPGAFKADHSEAEPQLVFFKATSAKPAQTNALITTRGGHEISLSLVSQGKSDRSEPVDYVLNCERPRSFLIASTHPAFVVGETKSVATTVTQTL